MTAVASLDAIDRRLLNEIQKTFPLVAQPFAAIAERLGIDEEDALARTLRLKEDGIIRQISAIFDSRRLGYSSTLVAMSIPEEHVDESAGLISEHQGVSHNYKRDNPFNVWFTLTLPPEADLESEVTRLSERARAERTRILPAVRLFKIGVELDLEQGTNAAEKRPRSKEPPRSFTEADLAYVRVLQQDVALESTPFQAWAESLGVSQEEMFAKAKDLEASGVMRRFAAVLRHQRAGFLANGMICWRIPEDQLPDLGHRLAAYPQVSHCYQRPVFPDWPYSVFSMVHARSREGCEEIASKMSQEIGISDYAILYSTKEYKKERVKYYVG
ncbi:MAG: AsnC family transcriptional regulator [Dehalococcoidia bacterium]